MFVLFVLGCNGLKTNAIPQIPESAFWAKNNEKGNWFDVEWINNHRNMALVSIFDESGKLVFKGKFMKICPIDELKYIEDLEEEIDFFDGTNIQLKDNCYLKPN